MGFDTHMILETVPAPHSKRSNTHQVINRTPRHYAGTLPLLWPGELAEAFILPRRQPPAPPLYAYPAYYSPDYYPRRGTRRPAPGTDLPSNAESARPKDLRARRFSVGRSASKRSGSRLRFDG